MATVPSTGTIKSGDLTAQNISARFGGTVATRLALSQVGVKARTDGQMWIVKADPSSRNDYSQWVFTSETAPATADGATASVSELVVLPTAGSGFFQRNEKCFTAKFACTFATADAAVLFTVPEGYIVRLIPNALYWEITTSFTGGSSSAIGVSSNKSGYSTKGDLLGGATGDVLAALDAGVNAGTIGPKFDTTTEAQALLLVEGDTLRFDRITSVFTAGAGFVCVPMIFARAPATP